MYQNNNGYKEQENLQNRFTAFVVLSLRRKKITYINCQRKKKDNLYSLDDGFLDYMPDSSDFVEEVCDKDLVRRIMCILTPKERYIITSEEGTLLRMNRFIRVERVFGLLKENYRFRRFITRGKRNIEMQFFLLAFAMNIEKLCNRAKKGRIGLDLFKLNAS